jgi:hypothetical protein
MKKKLFVPSVEKISVGLANVKEINKGEKNPPSTYRKV